MKLVHAFSRNENQIIRGRYWYRVFVPGDNRVGARNWYAPEYELRVVGLRTCRYVQ